MSDIQGLYRNFKRRVSSFINVKREEEEKETTTSSVYHAILLLSNMLAVYENDDPQTFNKRKNILIYWPKVQEESSTKTCIIDNNFERTNFHNQFHIVYRDVLSNNIIQEEEEESNIESSSIQLKFKQCSCFHHRKDIPFDWSEFITYDLIYVLHRYYTKIHSNSLSSSSSSSSSSPSSPTNTSPLNDHISDTVNRILDEYFSNSRRLRREDVETHLHLNQYSPLISSNRHGGSSSRSATVTKSINVKPMGLSHKIKEDIRRFDKHQVFNNVIFQSNAVDMYKEYESDVMILFSNNRLSSYYDRYFSNKHLPSHPVTCHLTDVSIKLHLYDGIITLHAVDELEHHPYYVLLSPSALKTTNLDVNLLNIYMPFQSSELDMSKVCHQQENGFALDEIFGNNLCIIECREDLQFSFKTIKKNEPFMIAIITPGKCTINSTSCHYDLWTHSSSQNAIPFYHLIQSKTSYLSSLKTTISKTSSSTSIFNSSSERKRRLSNDTTSLPPPNTDRRCSPSSSLEDDNKENGNHTKKRQKGEDEEVSSSSTSFMNEIKDVFGLKVMIDEFEVDQYGSIFDFYEKEKRVNMIQSIREDDDSFPIFYLNNRLLHLHITENDSSSLENERRRQTLYYNGKPLTHVDVDNDSMSISFEPVYLQNSCHRQGLIAY